MAAKGCLLRWRGVAGRPPRQPKMPPECRRNAAETRGFQRPAQSAKMLNKSFDCSRSTTKKIAWKTVFLRFKHGELRQKRGAQAPK
jgi:hypothetical protein